MSDSLKYYYLKLKDNFYDQPEIKAIESYQNGYEYICIIQKMYLRSLSREGKLMLTDSIPYDLKILAKVLGHKEETIKAAIEIFCQFGLCEILDDQTIYMTEIQNYIGLSSTEADRKRLYRAKIESHKLLKGQTSGQMSDKNPPEIELEQKKEREKKNKFIPPSIEEFIQYFIDNGYSKELAERAYKGYDVNDWKDSKGNKIVSWKQKAIHVWFKEENKTKKIGADW